jgi:predicted DNA-binding transcriptional regulator AlpA
MIMTKAYNTPSLLRIDAVMARTGFKSKSSLYDAISKGTFIKPIKLSASGRSVAWPSDQVDNWIAGRIAAAKEA